MTIDVTENDSSFGNEPVLIQAAGYSGENPEPGDAGMEGDGAQSENGGFCKPNDDRKAIVYTSPTGNFTGLDRCTYTGCDKAAKCASATLFIVVIPSPTTPSPTAKPTSTSNDEDNLQCASFSVQVTNSNNGEGISIDVLSRCTGGADPLEVAKIEQVPEPLQRSEVAGVSSKRMAQKAERQGIEIIVGDGGRSSQGGFCFPSTSRRTVVYFPPQGAFTGEDSCAYVVRDDDGNEVQAILTIAVQGPTPATSPRVNDIGFTVPDGQVSRVSPLVNDIPAPGAAPLKIFGLLDIGFVIATYSSLIEASLQRQYRKRIAGRGRNGKNERRLQERTVDSLQGGTCRVTSNNLDVTYTPPNNIDPPFTDICAYEVVDNNGFVVENPGLIIFTVVAVGDLPTVSPTVSPTLSPALTGSPSLSPTLSP